LRPPGPGPPAPAPGRRQRKSCRPGNSGHSLPILSADRASRRKKTLPERGHAAFLRVCLRAAVLVMHVPRSDFDREPVSLLLDAPYLSRWHQKSGRRDPSCAVTEASPVELAERPRPIAGPCGRGRTGGRESQRLHQTRDGREKALIVNRRIEISGSVDNPISRVHSSSFRRHLSGRRAAKRDHPKRSFVGLARHAEHQSMSLRGVAVAVANRSILSSNSLSLSWHHHRNRQFGAAVIMNA
jgi:hypothetical protein